MMHKYKDDFLLKSGADFYYILGAFITDGNIYCNPETRGYRAYLYSNDLDWLQDLNKYFCDTNLIYKNREKCHVLTISSKKIVEKFIDHGCVPNKSLTVDFPKIPQKYLPDFIRGCVDGDGTICIYNNKKYIGTEYKICSSSLKFATGFFNMLKNMDIKSSFVISPAKKVIILGRTCDTKEHYIISIKKREHVKQMLKWTYYKNFNFSLKRKLDKANLILNLPDAINLASENNPLTPFKNKDIVNIRKIYKEGMSQLKIAQKYSVSRSCIQGIVNGKRWKSVK